MKHRKTWIAGICIIVAALITGVCTYYKKETTPGNSLVQNNDSRENNNAERDINKNTGDVINAQQTTQNNGNSISVNSTGQTGGITAANVIIVKNIKYINVGNHVVKIDMKDNATCEIDTVNKIIRVQPKQGSWENIFFGLPVVQKDIVKAHFSSTSKGISSKTENEYLLDGDSLYAMMSKGIPSTPDFFYSMHYQVLPTYIVFGNYPKPLYKIKL